jgi:hypothetical protein
MKSRRLAGDRARPRNEGQHKVRVLVKPTHSPDGSQSIALCWSEGRTQKDRAIRQKQEDRFLADVEKLAKRIAVGRLRAVAKTYEAIGRLKERYPRVARYYELACNEEQSELSCTPVLIHIALLTWCSSHAGSSRCRARYPG